MAVFVSFNAINAVTLNTNCTVSLGENNQTGRDSHQKSNNTIGPVSGINFSAQAAGIVMDQDVFDKPIFDGDFKPGIQIQKN